MTKLAIRSGYVLTTLVTLFMAFDRLIHIMRIAPVVQTFAQLGYPLTTAVPLGVLELVWVALLLIPRTSILGALL
jgi:DoxX-like family